jgi:hypothetical protein
MMQTLSGSLVGYLEVLGMLGVSSVKGRTVSSCMLASLCTGVNSGRGDCNAIENAEDGVRNLWFQSCCWT